MYRRHCERGSGKDRGHGNGVSAGLFCSGHKGHLHASDRAVPCGVNLSRFVLFRDMIPQQTGSRRVARSKPYTVVLSVRYRSTGGVIDSFSVVKEGGMCQQRPRFNYNISYMYRLVYLSPSKFFVSLEHPKKRSVLPLTTLFLERAVTVFCCSEHQLEGLVLQLRRLVPRLEVPCGHLTDGLRCATSYSHRDLKRPPWIWPSDGSLARLELGLAEASQIVVEQRSANELRNIILTFSGRVGI